MANHENNGEENKMPQYTDPNGTSENSVEPTDGVAAETIKDVADNAAAETVTEASDEVQTDKETDVQGTSSTTSTESTQDLNKNYRYGSGDYSQNQNYQQGYGSQNYNQGYGNQNQSYNQGYQNYSQGYNQGYNQNYQQGMDMTPLSLGQWILTILAAFIPCVGTILYFIWAFSKNGNINRRNYSRAALIVQGAVLLLYMIFVIMFGMVLFGAGTAY